MVKSMTSFGREKQSFGQREITVEIRSVNNRYFDCSVRLPRAYSALESKIKPHLASRGIVRGKVDVSVYLEDATKGCEEIVVNTAYAEMYISALRALKSEFSLDGEINVMDVAKNSEIFLQKRAEENEEEDWRVLSCVLDAALEKFLDARAREGERIASDLLRKLSGIEQRVSHIGRLSDADTESYRRRLEEKIKTALSDNSITIDENRILTECAIYADKVAIDEELVRLESHFAEFRKYIASNEATGRSLDFLMQEMNREINTIGSKCQNSDIAHTVVEVKSELEKIREQIQNLE